MSKTPRAPFDEQEQLFFQDSGRLPAVPTWVWTGSNWSTPWQFHLSICLREALEDQAARRLLFGPDGISHNVKQQASILISMAAIAAWRINVSHIRGQLQTFRHDAIATPNMKTFGPLALLRRNIAHLEEWLSWAKDNQSTEAKEVFDRRRKIQGSKLQSLDDQYGALLQQVKDMSTNLNNEIQLVVGSVTVQVGIRRCNC